MPSPIQTATIQAAVLNITSSIIAQLLTAYRSSTLASSSTALNPLGLDYLPILHLLIVCLVITPPNYLWQEYLERSFPGYPAQKEMQKVKVDEDGKGVTIDKKLDLKNTAAKFVLDQTVGATVNTVVWLALLKALRGGSVDACVGLVREEFWSLMLAGFKLWPLVSLVNFTVVPVERRVVVGSLVGLGWGVFLALRAASS